MKLILFIGLLACGSPSVFKDIESSKPNYAAARALEEKESDKAIEVMEKALAKDPTNYNYMSILASAKAQKAGLDMVEMILTLAENSGSATSSSELELLFGIVPSPSMAVGGNIALLNEALTLMSSIPSGNKTTADILKQTIFYTAMSALQAKLLDSDGDGNLSVGEISNLTVTQAQAILANISSAASITSALEASGNEGLAAEKINDILDEINSESGSDVSEQLQNYLNN